MSRSDSSSRSSKKSKTKKWDTLPLPSAESLDSLSHAELHDRHLPQGYTLRFFPHDMRHMYTAPSKHVHLTRGVVDFINEYNILGPNKTKARIFLCTMFERSGACENGFMCREVHCDLKAASAKYRALTTHTTNSVCNLHDSSGSTWGVSIDEQTNPLAAFDGDPWASPSTTTNESPNQQLVETSSNDSSVVNPLCDSSQQLSPSTTAALATTVADDEIICTVVHMRNASEDAHPRLPPGVIFRLALPNMQAPVDEIPSAMVFVTKGSKAYYDQVCRGETPTMNMQHCAHFSKNGMCCFGTECQFVHVAKYKRRNQSGDTDSSGAESEREREGESASSRSSSFSGNSGSSGRLKGTGTISKKSSGAFGKDATPVVVVDSFGTRGVPHQSSDIKPYQPPYVGPPSVVSARQVPPAYSTLQYGAPQQQQPLGGAVAGHASGAPPSYTAFHHQGQALQQQNFFMPIAPQQPYFLQQAPAVSQGMYAVQPTATSHSAGVPQPSHPQHWPNATSVLAPPQQQQQQVYYILPQSGAVPTPQMYTGQTGASSQYIAPQQQQQQQQIVFVQGGQVVQPSTGSAVAQYQPGVQYFSAPPSQVFPY